MTEIEWRWVENSMQSREMKYFSFPMFNNFKRFFLQYKKFIIYKREKWDWNF